MQNQEAFTYCWIDHKTNMLYIGYHKGQQDDGYVCSSKWMLEEYNKRPEDFTRMILAEGTTEDCHALEVAILTRKNAKNDPTYYNMHNGDGQVVLKHHTEEARQKISKSHTGMKFSVQHKQNLSASRRKVKKEPRLGHKHTIESINLMKESHKGSVPWNKGKKMPASFGAAVSKRMKGTKLSSEERSNLSKAQKLSYSADSSRRIRQGKAIKEANTRKEVKARHSAAMKRRWKDPDYREEMSRKVTEQWKKRKNVD